MLNKNKTHVTIQFEVGYERESVIKAIAASFRWLGERSENENLRKSDSENIIVLANLLENLVAE